MITLFMEFALFLLVLFVVVPGTMVFLMVGRDLLHHNRKPAPWHAHAAGKLPG